MKRLFVLLSALFVSSFILTMSAQELSEDTVFFGFPALEDGISFNNIGVGAAQLLYHGEDSMDRKYLGVNVNYYRHQSWWSVLASAAFGTGMGEDLKGKNALYAGAYAGVDLVRSPKLAFELYPIGVCVGKYGGVEDNLNFGIGGASRFSIYFRYNMALFLGGEFSYPLKKDSRKRMGDVFFGVMLSL